ncbi:MAG: hypothetical protein WBA18_22565 [Terracidiphilus sp.]
MKGNRPKGAWIWVAIAAITFASLARAQSGIGYARAYATPVIKLLASNQLVDSDASAAARRTVSRSQAGTSTLALELLPVFFVGLVAPLSLLSPRLALCIGSAPSAHDLPDLFQRPPPVQFA